jgi:branched-chain amino acid transport system substrate-binding protein
VRGTGVIDAQRHVRIASTRGDAAGRSRGRLAGTPLVVLVTAALALGACTEEPPDTAADAGIEVASDDPRATAAPNPDADSVVEQFAGEPWFRGEVPAEPVEADGEPIRIGHINQEDVPIGSFPEVRLGAEAAVAFINAELGGVHGRPIELVTCIANFSVEGSQKCAQDMVQAGVVAVTGGLDITSNGSIPVLEQNGIPYVGGIPVGFDEMRSPISFQFSGGSPGAMTAFAQDAIDRGYDEVAVVYAEFGPVESAANDYAVRLLEANGVDVTAISYPILANDLLPVMTEAGEGDPDAIFMFAADAACVRAMETRADLGIEADLYMVGSCASPNILDEVGDAVDGLVFNIEGPLDMDTGVVDGAVYLEAATRYGPDGYLAQSAGTVSFRGVMNLWSVLADIPEDELSPEAVIDEMRSARERPSWDGHPYTCDGEQVPDLPALCAPQQVLVGVGEGGVLSLRSDGWIDVAAILDDLESLDASTG